MIDSAVRISLALDANKGAYAVLLGSGGLPPAGVPSDCQILSDLVTTVATGEDYVPHSLVFFNDIFSSERQYSTVGHLYQGIEDWFKYLVQKHCEEGLIVGPPQAQIAKLFFGLPQLNPATDLASAIAAIQGIVEQGEGARGDNESSNYSRFLAMGKEYDQMLIDDPEFCPSRPVVANPYSILP